MLALDVENGKEAFRLLDKISAFTDVIKFNYPLVLKEGISIITKVKKRYKKTVLADFKIADIPVTNNRIIKISLQAGADAAMIHGFIGIDALRSAKKAAGRMKLFLMTQPTNPGGLDFYAPYTDIFARLAKTLGFAGVQAPGNRPDVVRKVRRIVGKKMMLISCGIGKQGGEFGAAIKAGADFEIIGRAIYDEADPLKEIRAIAEKIKPFL